MPMSGFFTLSDIVREALHPDRFLLANGLTLEWQEGSEEIAWEIFHGRLLDPAHTRQLRPFYGWNVYRMLDGTRCALPLLSVRLDSERAEMHVVRAVLCRTWEAYDAGDNVIHSRETQKWLPELIGTLRVPQFGNTRSVEQELRAAIFRAVVGNSRLPLTSQEAPLPEFSLGQLGYYPGATALEGSTGDPGALLELSLGENDAAVAAKLIETAIRAAPREAIESLVHRCWSGRSADSDRPFRLIERLRVLVNDVSLTPYTDFVERTLRFLDRSRAAGQLSAETVIDFLCHLLRQIGRHLTAYDLITFHHRGANYPDALLLDAVLNALSPYIEAHPGLFLDGATDDKPVRKQKRLRRRGIRQAWLLWRRYANMPVPDVPTSPGENARVIPGLPAAPEEQILNPSRRTKRLFADERLDAKLGNHGREILYKSVLDLENAVERRELGTALFLDRPLGVFKQPGEPDQTPLLSYVAYSRTIAEQRLQALAAERRLLDDGHLADLINKLRNDIVEGVSLHSICAESRPGVVSLADARKVDPEFVLLKTTRRAAREFFELFDWSDLIQRGWTPPANDETVLIVRGERDGSVVVRHADGGPLLEMRVEPGGGYETLRGVELPLDGLNIVHAFKGSGLREAIDLGLEPVALRRAGDAG